MKPFPDRRAWLESYEPEWEKLLQEYHSQFPSHAEAGAWLAQHPTPGVHAEDVQGIGPVLVGWPEEVPAPDFEAWSLERAAASELGLEAVAQQRKDRALIARLATEPAEKLAPEETRALLRLVASLMPES